MASLWPVVCEKVDAALTTGEFVTLLPILQVFPEYTYVVAVVSSSNQQG